MSYSMLLINSTTGFSTRARYLKRVSYPKNHISNVWISVLPTALVSTKTTYHFKCKAIKKTVLICQATKNKVVLYRLYPSLMQIDVTTNAPALVQQFTHLVHSNRSYHLSYLFEKLRTRQEKCSNRKKTNTRGKLRENSTCDKPFFSSEK